MHAHAGKQLVYKSIQRVKLRKKIYHLKGKISNLNYQDKMKIEKRKQHRIIIHESDSIFFFFFFFCYIKYIDA